MRHRRGRGLTGERREWAVPARLRAALVAGGVLAVIATALAGSTPRAIHATASVNPHSRLAGVALSSLNQQLLPQAQDFPRLRADGVNEVTFDVYWLLQSSTGTLAPAPGMTDTDTDLAATAQQAEANGLQVAIMPMFIVDTSNDHWRGEYNPSDPPSFFANYSNMINHYAQLAQSSGMSLLYVGSEMNEGQNYTDLFRQVIAQARQSFSGQLAYNVNFDTYQKVHFWDALDLISVSAYFPLSNAEYPSVGNLEAGWHSFLPPNYTTTQYWLASLSQLRSQWGKPLIFGEVGYVPYTYVGRAPCCGAPSDTQPASQLQANAYQALLETFRGQSWWAGVSWYAWNAGGYSMRGLPAESLLGLQNVLAPGAPGAKPPAASRAGGAAAAARAAPPVAASAPPVGAQAVPTAGAPDAAGGATGLPTADPGAARSAPSAVNQAPSRTAPGGVSPLWWTALGLVVAAGAAGLVAMKRRRRPAGALLIGRRHSWLRRETPIAK